MSTFVIPMVGMSSRFFKAGYKKPKYQLDIHGQSMFAWSVSSFERYYDTDHFVFIVRDVYGTKDFITVQLAKLGIQSYQVIVLQEMTQGQAQTVYQGLQQSKVNDNEDIFIFNIDSRLNNFAKPMWIAACDGYLEVFQGEGDHWSFVQVNDKQQVIRTTEKQRISDLCSDGLYYFGSVELFNAAYQDAVTHHKLANGELYVAPLYNYLIEQQAIIKVDVVELADISFCGTHSEYLGFLQASAL